MSKLRAFQCQPQDEILEEETNSLGPAGAAKENPSTEQDREGTTKLQATPIHPSSSQKSAEKDVRECPQTPIGRLPLAELIAGGNNVHPDVDLPLVERVLWNYSQQSCDPDGSQGRRATMRGKKRAHSSSPSTSQSEPRIFKESSKLDVLQGSLKTPQADPVNDLWSRYSLATDKPSPTRRAETTLASPHSSSPQTPTSHWQGKESSKLRRSYSCNIEWPTSASKRRKLQYSSSNQEPETGYATHEHRFEATGRSKIARVSLLVEQLQSRLARSSTQENENEVDPSILLPFLEKTSFSTSAPVSPPQAVETEEPEPGDFVGYSTAPAVSRPHCPLPNNNSMADTYEHPQWGISPDVILNDDSEDEEEEEDEGEGEGDEGEEEEEGPDTLTSELLKTANDVESGVAVSTFRNAPSSPHRSEPSTSPCSPKDSPPGLDDFDDDDSETFAADLEDIVAKYDAQPSPQVQKLAARIPKNTAMSTRPESTTFGTDVSHNVRKRSRVESKIESGASSDDEFGGDFDFENIIAQCEEASQKPHSASGAQSSVRTRTFGPSK